MKKTFVTVLCLIAVCVAAQEAKRLPTGAMLDPVGVPKSIGNFPLALVAAPDGQRLVALLCGWRQQGIQVIDRATSEITQTIEQNAAFIGLTFSPDGRVLYASGGNDDTVYVYRWENGLAIADGKIAFQIPQPSAAPRPNGIRYPAGLATDGHVLYVAENLSDTLAVVDLGQRTVVQRMITDRYPYGVAYDAEHVYVTCWGDSTVKVFRRDESGLLSEARRITVSRHPSAILLRGNRLYVTSASSNQIDIVDTSTDQVVHTLTDSAPAGPAEGSTPNAVEVSTDGKRLFVAEADNNAVAIFDLDTNTLLGRVPTDWYPAALKRFGNTIYVACAKGHGSGPDPARVPPTKPVPPGTRDYTLGQLDGSIVSFPENVGNLPVLSNRVANANGWDASRAAVLYPRFEHVLYIVKENRSYDQVLGDMSEGDGDRSLVYFGERYSPNHHELARRFGLFDRFFVNAEVSADGHNWTMSAYASDYVEKTVQSNYSGRGRTFDYSGTNRNVRAFGRDDVNSPSTGYLWDMAMRKKIFLRNYGEFVHAGPEIGLPDTQYYPSKRALLATSSKEYPNFDLDITDQTRFEIWKKEFDHYVATGNLPTLEIIWLPNDHTAGAAAGRPTPRAYMADNDLALGRIVEAVSNSPYWHNTVIFVLEDDAQSGPDHVDSHRSLLFVISPYSRAGVVHRFTNTTDVLATIEQILGLESMSQFDFYGRPLRGLFSPTADLRPYMAIKPKVDLNERNPPSPLARESAKLDLDDADAADEDTFNRILWKAIKGTKVPYPGSKRAPTPVGR